MRILFLHTSLIYVLAVFNIGCSIPKYSYTLVPPAELTQIERGDISKECMIEAQKLSKAPLTESEAILINDVETARFFEGGRGRNAFSDRYVLCFLNKNYKLLKEQPQW